MKQESVYFIKYVLIGLVGVTLDFVIFTILFKVFGTNIHIANFFGVTIGITNNFLMNTFFNFKLRQNLKKRFILFYSVGALGFLISTIILYIFVDLLNLNGLFIKIFTIFIVTLFQYSLNRLLTFKDTKYV